MSLIPEEIISQVIDRTDIVETISAYIPLRKAGRNFKALCPFHPEKTPSFVVNPDKQIYHCFGCGEGGNVISFVMKQDHLEFPEAIRLLAGRANITIPEDRANVSEATNLRQLVYQTNAIACDYFHKILISDKSLGSKRAREYLKERGVTLQTVKEFQLGFALDLWDGLIRELKKQNVSLNLMEKAGLVIPRENGQGYYDRFRNRVIFPIFDTQKRCVAFGARALNDSSAKYLNSPETAVYTKGRYLYGLHLAKPQIMQEDLVLLAEGYMDCLIPTQEGIRNIVASLGTALTVEQIRLLRRYSKNLVMIFDTDQAGQDAMMRSIDALIEEGMHVRIAVLDEGDDPDSFVRKNGAAAFKERVNNAQSVFDYMIDSLSALYGEASAEDKAKIAEKMLQTINRYPNALIKADGVKRLAQRLAVPEHVLITELKKISQGTQENRLKDKLISVQASELKHRVAERNILKLLLDEENFISPTMGEVELSDFQDERIRELIAKIFELFAQGRKVNSSNLINSIADNSLHHIITSINAEEEQGNVDKNKLYRDCMLRIKSDRIKMTRQELLLQIKEAESIGDESRLDELKKQFHNIIIQ